MTFYATNDLDDSDFKMVENKIKNIGIGIINKIEMHGQRYICLDCGSLSFEDFYRLIKEDELVNRAFCDINAIYL